MQVPLDLPTVLWHVVTNMAKTRKPATEATPQYDPLVEAVNRLHAELIALRQCMAEIHHVCFNHDACGRPAQTELHRHSIMIGKPILTTGSVTVDQHAREVIRNGTMQPLSPQEYALFVYLLRHKGRVQSRPAIIEHVWGKRDDLVYSKTVDVHVAYLRRKLGQSIIKTVPGQGYVIPLG